MIPCVILCGGKSSRMGRSKALLPFPIEPLAIVMSKKMQKLFPKVYLSLKDPTPLMSYGVDFIQEETQVFAPMVGIKEAFEKLGSEKIFFLSVDTPFITQDVMQTLLARSIQGITYARDEKKEHYLCGVYSRASYPILLEQMQKQDYKMSHFINLLPHIGIEFSDYTIFENLNTQEQYLKALERLEQNV